MFSNSDGINRGLRAVSTTLSNRAGVGPPAFRIRQWFSGALTIGSWPINILVAEQTVQPLNENAASYA